MHNVKWYLSPYNDIQNPELYQIRSLIGSKNAGEYLTDYFKYEFTIALSNLYSDSVVFYSFQNCIPVV